MHATLPRLVHTDFPPLTRRGVETLQVNLGYRCNQSCLHCHVNAGPKRTEEMSAENVDAIIAFLEANPSTTVVQVNGCFHSDEHLGTVEQLLRYRPDTKVAVVSIVPDETFPAFDREAFGSLGDVIIMANPRWREQRTPARNTP